MFTKQLLSWLWPCSLQHNEQNGAFLQLPNEIIEEICTYLSLEDLKKMRLVCRRLKPFSDNILDEYLRIWREVLSHYKSPEKELMDLRRNNFLAYERLKKGMMPVPIDNPKQEIKNPLGPFEFYFLVTSTLMARFMQKGFQDVNDGMYCNPVIRGLAFCLYIYEIGIPYINFYLYNRSARSLCRFERSHLANFVIEYEKLFSQILKLRSDGIELLKETCTSIEQNREVVVSEYKRLKNLGSSFFQRIPNQKDNTEDPNQSPTKVEVYKGIAEKAVYCYLKNTTDLNNR